MIYTNRCEKCRDFHLSKSPLDKCRICGELDVVGLSTGGLTSKPVCIGILGLDHTGLAIANGFRDYANIKAWDANPDLSINTFDETLDSDFIFISVPTTVHQPGMGTDLTQLHAVLASAKAYHDRPGFNRAHQPTYILKSTVPVGTTDMLIQTTGLRIVCSPSFLSKNTANFEFLTTTNTLIGTEDVTAGRFVSTLFQLRFPVVVYRTSARNAEFTKHMISCFLATKVALLNEFNLLAEQIGIDWQHLMPGFLSDGRISQSNLLDELSTYDEDVCDFRHTMRKYGVNPHILDAVWEQIQATEKRS